MTTFREQMQEATEVIIDAFGEEVTFTGTSGPYAINAIFDEEVISADDYTGQMINTPPMLTAKTKDLVGVKPHDKVKVGLVTYEVITIDPDGSGASKIKLSKVRNDG